MQGCFIISHLQIGFHKEHMKEEGGKQNTFLVFSSEEWNMVTHVNDDEVLLDGKMFDVKAIDLRHGQVIVYGHYDTKEDMLLAQAKDLQKKNQDQKNSDSPLIHFNLFCQDIVPKQVGCYFLPERNSFPIYSIQYLFRFQTVEIPPPRLIA